MPQNAPNPLAGLGARRIDYARPGLKWPKTSRVIGAFTVGIFIGGSGANLLYYYVIFGPKRDESLFILFTLLMVIGSWAFAFFTGVVAFQVRRGKRASRDAVIVAVVTGLAFGMLPAFGFTCSDYSDRLFAIVKIPMWIAGFTLPTIVPAWLFRLPRPGN